MFCPQCGTAPTPGGRFCGNCGLLLPFAPMAGAAPDAGTMRASSPAFASTGAPVRPAPVSVPTFTLAVVACVIAFGVVFVGASAVVHSLTGDSRERSLSAQSRAPNASQGAMGALLSNRRAEPVDHDRSQINGPTTKTR